MYSLSGSLASANALSEYAWVVCKNIDVAFVFLKLDQIPSLILFLS